MTKIVYCVMVFISFSLITACGSKPDSHDHDSEEEAIAENKEHEETNNNIIVFTKEQEKYVLDFKAEEVKKQTFYQILKTNGQILSAPGDEVLISATMSGMVSVSTPNLVEGLTVNAGQQLFSISAKNLSENNTTTRLNESKAVLNVAKAEYERASELAKEKIISQKEFQQIQLAYDQAKLNYQTYSAGMNGGNKSVSTPIKGFVKNLLIQSGQYVEIGQALATVTQNRRLILRADVSQRYTPLVKNVKTATFVTPYDGKTYDLTELEGRLISVGRNSGENSYFTPVNFEFDNKGNIVEGTFVEIYLKSLPIADAIVLPISALLEEQGRYFVFIKLDHDGEYAKKEVKIGASDGINRHIIAGISEGEKVVTIGAYALKLASMSNAMPEDGHQH